MEEIIIKVCTNQELTPTEKLTLEVWLSESPRNRKIYAQIKLSLLSPGVEERARIQEEVWSDLMGRIKPYHDNSFSTEKRRKSKTSKMFSHTWIKAAAVIVFSFFLGLTTYKMSQKRQHESEILEVRIIEKVSMPGQKVTTHLPDGTLVTLNAASKIQIPDSFGKEDRKVSLQGEAFFDVVRDESKPFIIELSDIQVEVLGTSFNVRSYPEENLSVVAVASGKVLVSNEVDHSEALQLGEKITYTSESKLMERGTFEWENEFGWKENVLRFQDKKLSEIMMILSRWYGVDFRIENAALEVNKEFSGRYKDPTLKAVLEGLSFVYGFNYEIDKKVVILK